jgi:hypothetical protein
MAVVLLLYREGSIVVGVGVFGVDVDGNSQLQVNDYERNENRINPK